MGDEGPLVRKRREGTLTPPTRRVQSVENSSRWRELPGIGLTYLKMGEPGAARRV